MALAFIQIVAFASIWLGCHAQSGQVESEFVFRRDAGITSIWPTMGDTNGGTFVILMHTFVCVFSTPCLSPGSFLTTTTKILIAIVKILLYVHFHQGN